MLIANMLLVGALTYSGELELSPLPSPAPTNARFPSLVAGADDELYLCWTESIEAGSRLCFARPRWPLALTGSSTGRTSPAWRRSRTAA